MLKELKTELNRSVNTENGAKALKSTQSSCLDLFAAVGALRNQSEQDIIVRFELAYKEDADLAMKILFFARDVRCGLGERRVFKTILKSIADTYPASVVKNIRYVAEYGRYDDLLALLDTACENDMLAYLKMQFLQDMEALEIPGKPVSLLGKWLPSVNASSSETVRNAKRIARALGLDSSAYRKALSALRARIRILENNLREKDYSFDYSEQPSRAMHKYRKAFIRNDRARYLAFLERVEQGSAKMHTDTLAPYDIVTKVIDVELTKYWCFSDKPVEMDADERRALDVVWKSLPDITSDTDSLVVVDGSGSMYSGNPMAISVAMSLGIYVAEHLKGEFKNHFITFSQTPQLVKIEGKDIYEKVRNCMKYSEAANTDILAVFRLLLDTAVKYRMTQQDMVKRIIIMSDMEFDQCTDHVSLTGYECAKQMYEEKGFTLPEIVFWNVQSRHTHQPVSKDESGTVLVSGFTPGLYDMLMVGEISPYAQMMQTVCSERYLPICA